MPNELTEALIAQSVADHLTKEYGGAAEVAEYPSTWPPSLVLWKVNGRTYRLMIEEITR